MKKIKAIRTKLPKMSILKKNERFYDYVDSYQSEFADKAQSIGVVEIGRSFFLSGPKLVGILFFIRNKIVGLFGLKTSENTMTKQKRKENLNFEVGTRHGLFKVFDKTDNEIILGENDKHLDFRISLFTEPQKVGTDRQKIIISTIVKYNNGFGKLYFFLVKPFHKLIVPKMLKGIVRDLEN